VGTAFGGKWLLAPLAAVFFPRGRKQDAWAVAYWGKASPCQKTGWHVMRVTFIDRAELARNLKRAPKERVSYFDSHVLFRDCGSKREAMRLCEHAWRKDQARMKRLAPLLVPAYGVIAALAALWMYKDP